MVCDGGLMVQASSTLGRVVMSEISLAKAVAIARPVSETTGEEQTDAQTATSSEADQTEILIETPEGEVVETQETTAEYGPSVPLQESSVPETLEFGPGFVTEEESGTETETQPVTEAQTEIF